MEKIKKNSMPKVSVAVVNYNAEKCVEGILSSLRKTKYPNYEVIFVDNASNDNSMKIVEKKFPEVKLVANKINRGFAGGANDGIKACSLDSEYIVTLNSDMLVDPHWLSPLVDIMQSNNKIGLITSALLDPDTDKIQNLGHIAINENLAKFSKLARGEDLDKFKDRDIIDIAFAAGLMRKSVLEKVGLFDEKTFILYEEVDLCRRMTDAGYRIVATPKSKIWHLESQSLKKSDLRVYYSYKNRLRYVLKHNKGINKVFFASVLGGIYSYKMLELVLNGKLNRSWVIAKGIGWNIKNWKDYF